jgi:hypothetical protein
MAYINFQNCTKQEYDNTIYGQNDVNSCKLYFNNVELQDADNYLEKITFKKRVLPENGKKIFNLDNFIAEEVEIIIHDIDTSIIQDKVRIELGTLVNNTYEYVPMGVYNIQDTPTRNDDKITIKLRDNAVLFDFNYNAYDLINSQYKLTEDDTYLENKEYFSYINDEYVLLVAGTDYNVGDTISGDVYERKGTATKLQILQDMCSKANVTCNVNTFVGYDDEVGYYDSTIKARMYVAYLAEQAGCIAKIDRNGALIFIPLNNLYTQRIPLSVVSKYVKGTTYTIERLVYELGTIKFESSNDETLQTLYISATNPFIETQGQIDLLYVMLNNIEFDSVEILSDIIGNPSIDGYDLIQVYDDESENDVVVFTTLANNTLTYNGKFKSKYKTEIGLEERTENVTNTGEAVFQKTITQEIDRTNGKITSVVSETKTYTDNKTSELNSELQGQINGIDDDLQEYKETVSSEFQQTSDSFTMQFTSLNQLVNQVSNTENAHHTELVKYIRFVNGVIILGEEGNPLTAELSNNRLSFKQNGNEVAYISNNKLNITDAEILEQVVIGNFAFIPRSNGSLSFRKVK